MMLIMAYGQVSYEWTLPSATVKQTSNTEGATNRPTHRPLHTLQRDIKGCRNSTHSLNTHSHHYSTQHNQTKLFTHQQLSTHNTIMSTSKFHTLANISGHSVQKSTFDQRDMFIACFQPNSLTQHHYSTMSSLSRSQKPNDVRGQCNVYILLCR